MNKRFDDILKTLPEHLYTVDNEDIIMENRGKVIVILDDDPTGTQTVHSIPVLTAWGRELIKTEFKSGSGLFYILTNTRSLPAKDACIINREITNRIKSVSEMTGRPVIMISRSDSTLRGHFPVETETIVSELAYDHYITVMNPAFFEGGRYTIANEHYVLEGEMLIKASDTPFAKDPDFGYKSSHLYEYVVEKTKGNIKQEDIFDLSIEDLRTLTIPELTEKVVKYRHKKVLIINAIDYEDEKKAVLAILRASKQDIKFIFRAAASVVPVIGGLTQRPLLQGHDLRNKSSSGSGIIVVGSHVPKTTEQLKYIKSNSNIRAEEIRVRKLLDSQTADEEISRISQLLNTYMKSRKDILIYTSREFIQSKSKNKKGNLDTSQKISKGIVEMIKNIDFAPSFIIAKGGITSSDLATGALNVRRAFVRGQILPGIPVWTLGKETKYPGMNYIVFPGNVGNDEALYETYAKLKL